ncbi:hypothetical protein AB6D78_05135 [Vibrio splendidus]
MLLVESDSGKVCGTGEFELRTLPLGYHLVDGPYVKSGLVVENISDIVEEILTISINKVKQNRQKAYKVESDPCYLEWQFDKTPESEKAWRDKVAEIKARYPLPTTE